MKEFLTILGWGIAAWLLIFWPLFIIAKLRAAWRARNVR